MTKSFASLCLGLALVGCGDQKDFIKDSDSYQVRNELNVTGNIILSFEQVSLYRSITIGATEADRCRAIAQDFSMSQGINLNVASLKLSYEEPSKHCARRNAFKQCETNQYIYTFSCQFNSN